MYAKVSGTIVCFANSVSMARSFAFSMLQIRELDRERTRMERDEKKLVKDIQEMAKKGQMKTVKIQARELVKTRNFITKFIQMKAHLNSVLLKVQTVKSHEAMASALSGTTKAMQQMNARMDLAEMTKIMQEFERQELMAETTQDMMGENLDGLMEGSDDEEEIDKIVSQTLDEIGINLDGDMAQAPMGSPVGAAGSVGAEQQAQPAAAAAPANPIGAAAAAPEGGGGDSAVSELEARLNNLRRD